MGLTAQKVRVELGGSTILHNIDFEAGDGELIGVLGPSGSGKSTLMLALNGFRPADEGRVQLDGTNLYEQFDDLRREIGYVPQDDIVPTSLQVERVLGYAAELRLPDFSPDEREGRVNGVLRVLDMAASREQRVSTLSGGQRKRVSIGVELLARPAILFADEPTSGLDPALERSLTKTFQNLTADGSTVVVTTHVMGSLELLDRICLLHGGHLAYFGLVDAIKDYFEVDDFADIYRRLEAHDPRDWRAKFDHTEVG